MNYIAAQTPLPRIATHPGVPNINRHGWKHQEMDDLAVLKRRACPRPLLVRMGGENDSAKTSERERGGGKGERETAKERRRQKEQRGGEDSTAQHNKVQHNAKNTAQQGTTQSRKAQHSTNKHSKTIQGIY